jgi:pimeloyl-ACP methyl ester carboxylesterase
MMKILKWLKRILLIILGLVFVLLLTGFVYEHISRFQAKRKIPVRGELIDIGDHKLNINLKGTGVPLVVFEAGVDGGGSLVWSKVQDEVSEFNATASYDRAGILFSERGKSPKTGEAIAVELHTLLQKAGQKGPYILVGHSGAGLSLRSFVAKYPKEVSGIIFVDVSHPDQFNRLKEVFGSMAFRQSPKWINRLACSVGIVRMQAKTFSFINTSVTDSINIITRKFLPKSFPAVSEEEGNALAIIEETGKITSFGDIPLIVITGTGDSRRASFPTEEMAVKYEEIWMGMQKDLLKLSTNSEHVLASKSGHYVQLEQPEVVVEAIRKLLTEVADTTETK